MRSRQKPQDRKSRILRAASALAKRQGLKEVTRDSVAAAAKCSGGLVNHYFGSMTGLRDAIRTAAKHDKPLSDALRKQALAAIT